MDQEKIIIEKEGKEVECDILFTFTCEDTGKGYVGFTDHSKNEKSEENIYTASYYPEKGYDVLEEIYTEEEKEMVKEVIESVKTAILNQESGEK